MLIWSSAAQDKVAVTYVIYCALAAWKRKSTGAWWVSTESAQEQEAHLFYRTIIFPNGKLLGPLTDVKLSSERVIQWIKYQMPCLTFPP